MHHGRGKNLFCDIQQTMPLGLNCIFFTTYLKQFNKSNFCSPESLGTVVYPHMTPNWVTSSCLIHIPPFCQDRGQRWQSLVPSRSIPAQSIIKSRMLTWPINVIWFDPSRSYMLESLVTATSPLSRDLHLTPQGHPFKIKVINSTPHENLSSPPLSQFNMW